MKNNIEGETTEINVQVIMTEERDSYLSVSSDDVMTEIENKIEEGEIEHNEDWELTQELWDEVTSNTNLENYRTHNMDYYEENFDENELDGVKMSTIRDIIEQLVLGRELQTLEELV